MLKKRLIFSLLYDQGRYCLSRNFRLQRVGDLRWLLKNYNLENVTEHLDELVIFNVSRPEPAVDDLFCDHVATIVECSFLPVSVGGGVRSMKDAERLFKVGADKIILNTSIHEDPLLVRQLSEKYGAQAIVASIDCEKEGEAYYPKIRQGNIRVGVPLEKYIAEAVALGIGELFLTSMERDGTGQGFDFQLYDKFRPVTEEMGVPLIVSGGAGKFQHFEEAFRRPYIDAASTANILNFIGNSLPEVRRRLIDLGCLLARW